MLQNYLECSVSFNQDHIVTAALEGWSSKAGAGSNTQTADVSDVNKPTNIDILSQKAAKILTSLSSWRFSISAVPI